MRVLAVLVRLDLFPVRSSSAQHDPFKLIAPAMHAVHFVRCLFICSIDLFLSDEVQAMPRPLQTLWYRLDPF